jgi:hypothetical protein
LPAERSSQSPISFHTVGDLVGLDIWLQSLVVAEKDTPQRSLQQLPVEPEIG